MGIIDEKSCSSFLQLHDVLLKYIYKKGVMEGQQGVVTFSRNAFADE